MECEVQPKNFAAVEGYKTTFFSASRIFNSLLTPDKLCSLSSNKTMLWLDEQFNSDCECWLDDQTFCYHDANSSNNADECCRSIVTLHILPHVNKTLVFTCFWPDEYFNYHFTFLQPDEYFNYPYFKYSVNVRTRTTSKCK